jgi:hypothetical protein
MGIFPQSPVTECVKKVSKVKPVLDRHSSDSLDITPLRTREVSAHSEATKQRDF